jgi:hypothetical protein
LTIYPPIADSASKNLLSKRMEFFIMAARSPILEVMKASKFWNKIGIERLKENTTGNLRSNQVAQPSGTASSSAGYQDAPAQILIGINVEAATHGLNYAPGKFTAPESNPIQWISVFHILRIDAT